MVPKNAARASACTLLSGRSSHILGFRPQDRETITDRRENKTARLPRNSHGCLGHCTPPANPRGVETLATWRQPDLCDESTMPCVSMRGVYTRNSESISLGPWRNPGLSRHLRGANQGQSRCSSMSRSKEVGHSTVTWS